MHNLGVASTAGPGPFRPIDDVREASGLPLTPESETTAQIDVRGHYRRQFLIKTVGWRGHHEIGNIDRSLSVEIAHNALSSRAPNSYKFRLRPK